MVTCYNFRMELLYVYYAVVFYLGTILGSFLNVVALDIQKLFAENNLENRNELFFFTRHISKRYFWRSLISRRSHCDTCGKTLSTFELFPLFSFIVQRGRCTACGAKIPVSHLWVELFCGVYFLGIFYSLFTVESHFTSAFAVDVFFWVLFFGVLFVLALFDYRTQLIPDVLLCLGVLLLTGAALVSGYDLVWWHIAAALVMAGMFYAVWFFSRGQWIGFADGKLAGVIGLVFGFSEGFTVLAVSFWAGAFVCLLLLFLGRVFVKHRSLSWGEAVPFGPFMVFGAWYVFVFGINLFHITV